MGNKHSKWFPEAARRGWTHHRDERYTQLCAHRSRPRSRKASRKCTFLETIEEERLISEDRASAQNNHELLLPQDTETHPVAPMPPETVQAPEVTQPAALMDPNPKEAQGKMKRIPEAKSDGQEQPCPAAASLTEEPVLPNGSAPGKRKDLMEERVSYCFYNRAESENPEEARIVRVTVWNADDLTPEDEAIIELEGHLFGYQERATKKEIPAPVEHGIDGLHCGDEVLQCRHAKETDCPQEMNEEYPLVPVSQEFLQSKITAAEVKDYNPR